MLMGLKQFGYKRNSLIKLHWLPSKTENEIKHRYKNLTCGKAHENLIKKWKKRSLKPLNDEEKSKLA